MDAMLRQAFLSSPVHSLLRVMVFVLARRYRWNTWQMSDAKNDVLVRKYRWQKRRLRAQISVKRSKCICKYTVYLCRNHPNTMQKRNDKTQKLTKATTTTTMFAKIRQKTTTIATTTNKMATMSTTTTAKTSTMVMFVTNCCDKYVQKG